MIKLIGKEKMQFYALKLCLTGLLNSSCYISGCPYWRAHLELSSGEIASGSSGRRGEKLPYFLPDVDRGRPGDAESGQAPVRPRTILLS